MEIEYFIKTIEKFLKLLDSQLEHFSSKSSTLFDPSDNPLSPNYLQKPFELTDSDNANFLFSRIDMFISEYPQAISLCELLQKYKNTLSNNHILDCDKSDLFKTKVYLKALTEFQEHLKVIEKFSIEKALNS